MKRIISIILVALTLCLAFAGCAKKEEPKQTVGGGVGLIVDPNAGDYEAPETQAGEGGIAIPGWGEITMPPNQTDNIVVDFYNPEANEGKYYLMFELYLTNADGSKDVLYKSDLVPPGKHIQRIKLAHGLAEGEYEATMFVQPYKMDGTLTSTNNLNAKTKLIVK